MAIQKNITDSFGATHTASYTRITRLIMHDNRIDVGVGIYHNAAARSKGDSAAMKTMLSEDKGLLTGSDFDTYFADSVLDNNGISPLKQAYAWLKTQNGFMDQNWTTGTTDV